MIVPSYPVGEQKFMLYPDPFNKQLLNANGIYYYPLLDSTNAEIRRLAEEGAPDDTVVLADAQSAGRGRQAVHGTRLREKGSTFLSCCVHHELNRPRRHR